MRDFDIINKPAVERRFSAQEIADMTGVHLTTVFSAAKRTDVEKITEGHRIFFPYLSMKIIVENLGKKVKTPYEQDHSLVTDQRCFVETWFPDPIPNCLKDDGE